MELYIHPGGGTVKALGLGTYRAARLLMNEIKKSLRQVRKRLFENTNTWEAAWRIAWFRSIRGRRSPC